MAQSIFVNPGTATDIPGVSAGLGGTPLPMGLGSLITSTNRFKRKFRWSFEVQYCLDGVTKDVPNTFLKKGARPNIEIDEQQIDYLNGRFWIPGKGVWQPLTISYYDVAGPTTDTNALLGWIASVYDITDSVTLHMGSSLSDYTGFGRIFLFDGCGHALEGWGLKDAWPKTINFGELDMSSMEECTIDITLRYSTVDYFSYCPTGTIPKCACTPCS